MSKSKLSVLTLSLILASALVATRAPADEGMWTFNHLPLDKIEKVYGFRPSADWVDHVMKSSLRIAAGGSGSFVSADGLILTNHHVAADTLQNVSTAEQDYIKNGFYAATLPQEIKAPALWVDQLETISDVTDRVKGAIQPGMSEEQANQAKAAVIAKIIEESDATSGLKSEVVTLYRGAQYELYQYKRYTDIRIVFAPEFAAAFFGGDPDNFMYPRYDLDMTLLRAYEDGKPAQIRHFLKWSEKGAQRKELAFVTGNPGATSRLYTVEAFRTAKDLTVPFTVELNRAREKALIDYSATGAEAARRAHTDLFGIQNSLKVYVNRKAGLTEAALAQKKKDEDDLRAKVAADPALAQYAGAWDAVASAEKIARVKYVEYTLLEGQGALYSKLFGFARTLVRSAAEDRKPEAERLPEYAPSQRAALKAKLFSPAPVFADLETARISAALTFAVERLQGHPALAALLNGKSPLDRARELVANSPLLDPKAREALYNQGQAGIDASKADPLIALALAIDEDSRKSRKAMEEQVTTPEERAYSQIAQARFAIFGADAYPDATFTPRLSYGAVKGYWEDGKYVPSRTHLGGAFEHEAYHGGQDPYELPASWHKAKDLGALDLKTPLNFVTTNDIIGGNSGSPVINQDGEVIGLIFDGNIQSIMGNFFYDGTINRAVSVHSAGMLEALRKIYGVAPLVDELLGKGKPNPGTSGAANLAHAWDSAVRAVKRWLK
jgi:hypothetical protein